MSDQDLTPEAVEVLIERLRIAYGGELSRDCATTLRALSAELGAERGWQTVAESNQQMAQPWQARAEAAEAKLKEAKEVLSLIAVVGYSDDPAVPCAIARQTVAQARAFLASLEGDKG